ncbi:Octopamine receptor beta-2R [Schistosoma japonicum]|uniref:Octopamine receptor beta-2R n=1 Tax=Schistosoma japonicum TaxID=6182 RepID=A0A4Z2D129_SCHJA|nr:Octopamine receptor beta-2R [Schistosoma japonicum]TNN10212.1 Octopamine receptor beta-2R [Schistosoma japonicum]
MLFIKHQQVNNLYIIHALHNNNNNNINTTNSNISSISTTISNQLTSSYQSTQSFDIIYIILNIIKGILYSLIIISALFGNALVFIAFIQFTRLQRIRTNLFLISLAIADFIVALLVMPFNAIMSLLNFKWIFGKTFCNIYNATDVLFSTASILHLCCISMDRYIAVMHPLNYESRMSKKLIIILLCLTWTLSFVISYIPILMEWHKPFNEFIHINMNKNNKISIMLNDTTELNDTLTCYFNVNPYYAVISSSISFWIPSIIMIIVYIRIFIEAKRQERKIAQLHCPHPQLYNTTDNQQISSSDNNSSGILINNNNSNNMNSFSQSIHYTPPINHLIHSSHFTNSIDDVKFTAHIKIHHESKAARTLGIVMGAFLICWLPFFLWYTITNVCNYCSYPNSLHEIMYWIGYFNSTINPIIYAYYNRTFRQAFIKILECQKVNTSNDDGQQYMDSYRSPISRRYKLDLINNDLMNRSVNNETNDKLLNNDKNDINNESNSFIK